MANFPRGRQVEGLFERVKQRKLVQGMLAYAAAAFALLQGVDIVNNGVRHNF